MRTLVGFLTAGLLGLVLVGVAHAAVLYAGPVRVDNGNLSDCALINVGKKDITDAVVTNTITNDNAIVGGPISVAPGAILNQANTNSSGGSQYAWCRFEFKGGKRNVRGTICVLDGGDCRAAAPAD